MKSLIISFLFFSFSVSAQKVPFVKGHPLNSTQQYEVMCWSIKKYESYRKTPYYCQAGKRTVGWGFTRVKRVKSIHHADKIFKGTVQQAFAQVDKKYPKFTYLQKAAITSLLFNTGDLQRIDNSRFIKALKEGNAQLAARYLQSWNKVRINGQLVESKGLTERRNFEAKLITGSFTIVDYFNLKKEVGNIYKKYK